MYNAVAERLASWPGWEAKLSRLERNVLFAGRSRANCYFCFFQRRYEWVWLLETHPDLFADAQGLEKEDYSFMQNLPLRDLRQPKRANRIFARRVDDVCEAITAKFQRNLFALSVLPADNELSLVSCGLMCGK